MERRALVACALYLVLLGTLFTGLFDAVDDRHEDGWPIILLALAATFGVGVSVARLWVALVPAVLCIIGFYASGAEALSVLYLLYVAPPLIGAALAGWLVGRFGRRAAVPIAVTAFALAFASVGYAAAVTIKDAARPDLPQSVQKMLPLDISLTLLCGGDDFTAAERRDAERKGQTLVEELRLHPDHVVEVDGDEVTVRELARQELDALEENRASCAEDIRRGLRRGLRDSA